MAFFDTKTEVINFELTPYGRELLAQGRLIPKYYEFDDSDILYDVSYDGNSSENQQDAHNRIMNETPRLKNILLKSGVESNFVCMETGEVLKDRVNNKRLTYDQRSVTAMGDSSHASSKSPSFTVQTLQGHISSSANILTSSVVVNMGIPQVHIDINAILHTASILEDDPYNYEYASTVYDDGKFVIVELEDPILYITEEDSFYEKDNFDIEVYHIEDDVVANYQQVEKLVPLLFNRNLPKVVNGVYHDTLPNHSKPEPYEFDFEPELETRERENEVRFYFTITTDTGIPEELICQKVSDIPIKNQYLDKELKCPETRTERFDLYSTQVRPEDIEDCD